MAQLVKLLPSKPHYLSSIPRMQSERNWLQKLPSNLHTHAGKHIHLSAYRFYTQTRIRAMKVSKICMCTGWGCSTGLPFLRPCFGFSAPQKYIDSSKTISVYLMTSTHGNSHLHQFLPSIALPSLHQTSNMKPSGEVKLRDTEHYQYDSWYPTLTDECVSIPPSTIFLLWASGLWSVLEY